MTPRHLSLALLLLAGMTPAGAAAAAGDDIFAGTQVHTIDIQFPQVAWWDSLVAYYLAGDEQYLAASVTFDGVAMDSVGVRLKGNASYNHPNDKKPFRLSFDEYIDSQRLDGLKGVHLNNCWEDPTFMREKLHLDFLRDAGIAAPRGNFAELSLNGELWGFYSLVEHVDKTFLSSRFGNNDGNLYKAVDGFPVPMFSDFLWYGSDPGAYYPRYELKTEESPEPWTDLIAVIDALNNSADVATSLPPVVNLDRLYRPLAVDNLLASLDGYAGSGRNFYFYFNEATGLMEWVPWDAGMSFGSYWGASQAYETLSLTYVINPANLPLAAKIFASPALSLDYLRHLCRISTDLFTTDRLFPQIDATAALIRPHVNADPRKMYTMLQFDQNLENDITVGGHRKPGLKAFIVARGANVRLQLSNLGISCDESIEVGDVVINEFMASNTLITDPSGETEDWIELFNATGQDIELGGLYLTDKVSQPTLWQFPDGTTIAAGGYLVVWADEDPGQPGLHASFKLSAGGESIVMSNGDLSVVDSVTFGAQVANVASARIPDGSGPFVATSPTPGGRNFDPALADVPAAAAFALAPAVPNPFNPATRLSFTLPVAGEASLAVYGLDGRRVRQLASGPHTAGRHDVVWDGRDDMGRSVASGGYLCRLQAGDLIRSRKLTLMK